MIKDNQRDKGASDFLGLKIMVSVGKMRGFHTRGAEADEKRKGKGKERRKKRKNFYVWVVGCSNHITSNWKFLETF